MLEIRPICENCACDLPPSTTEARICSFECTFCRTCVEGKLQNVCPNCGGGFEKRPVRVKKVYNGVSVGNHRPTKERIHRPVDPEKHAEFAASIVGVPPEQR